jgi:hypothetical protein
MLTLHPRSVKPGQSAEKDSYASLSSLASLQRTEAYDSAHRTSRALHLSLFEQPVREFNTLMIQSTAMGTEVYFT